MCWDCWKPIGDVQMLVLASEIPEVRWSVGLAEGSENYA